MASDGTTSKTLLWADYLVIVGYFLFVLVIGLWVMIQLLFNEKLATYK